MIMHMQDGNLGVIGMSACCGGRQLSARCRHMVVADTPGWPLSLHRSIKTLRLVAVKPHDKAVVLRRHVDTT